MTFRILTAKRVTKVVIRLNLRALLRSRVWSPLCLSSLDAEEYLSKPFPVCSAGQCPASCGSPALNLFKLRQVPQVRKSEANLRRHLDCMHAPERAANKTIQPTHFPLRR